MAANDLSWAGRRMNAKSYDYVIVGAGSAGCTLAHRLTEDARYPRAAARSRRLGPRSVDQDPDWAGAASSKSGCTTGCTSASPRPTLTGGGSNAPAARLSAAARRSTRWPMFAAIPAITTAGPHRGCPAGPTPRCCPISAARRAGRAAPAPIAAATARSPSARRVTATRWSRPASPPGGAATAGDARLQRRPAGGARAHPADDPPRAPVQRRRGLSAPGPRAGPT